MRELLILLVVVAAIAIIWYVRQKGTAAADQGTTANRPRAGVDPLRYDRPTEPGVGTPPGSRTRDDALDPATKGPGLFQDAATSAAGLSYERAADQMGEITAELAMARQDAERAAKRLGNRAAEALAAIEAAAASYGGAVPGDGTYRCPPNYPVKATMAAMRYLIAEDPHYDRTMPDVCFQSVAAAEAAGFSESGDEAGSGPGPVEIENADPDQNDLGPGPVRPRSTVAEDQQ